MKTDVFEHMCESLYDLTSEQREGLLNLLQSRIWLYELEEDSKFERINEFDDSAIKIILRKTPLELLSYALKGTTADLIKKFSKNMSKSDASKLLKKMKDLGPIRSSQRDDAQGKILEIINLLASAGEMELPFPLADIPGELVKSRPSANDDPLRLEANVLLTLSDSSLKALIREIAAAHWLDFLWYFNDARLNRKVFALSSPCFAHKLMNDFANRWQDVNLNTATEFQLEKGLQAMQKVLKTLYHLADMQELYIPH